MSQAAKTALQDKISLMTPEDKDSLMRDFLSAEYAASDFDRPLWTKHVGSLASYCGLSETEVERMRRAVIANLNLINQMIDTALKAA